MADSGVWLLLAIMTLILAALAVIGQRLGLLAVTVLGVV